MCYDPGKMTPARPLGNGLWAVDSFRGEPKTYVVNLAERSCDCPHFTNRLSGGGGVCKHVEAAETQARWLNATEKARKLTGEQITECLLRHGSDPIIGGALRCERDHRRAVAEENARLLSIFQ